ncbi:MAG TPA: cytochrome P450 [Micromonosporaceae bacterium]|nr:cytochrome P450 [Micromonosporaceae bacterium]
MLALIALLVVASLPYWLPRAVVRLRMWIFARVNGAEGIPVPGELVDVSRFIEVYSDPAACGRSRGAALSDLFWYWLSPGAQVHQEHLEPGPRYDDVARATRRILAMPSLAADQLAVECVKAALPPAGTGLVRLRDLVMPVWAELYHRVVFGRPATDEARAMIVANADDVVTALKCCGLRHMDRRLRLAAHLERVLDQVPHELPSTLDRDEQALYLQGTFFNTAVVQSSEATAHVLMVLAANEELQRAAAGPAPSALDWVLDETLRAYPLFGVAHRITAADIPLAAGTVIPAGSVLCFSYPDFHRAGGDIPFGVAANRPCPAWHIAPVTVKAVAREVLARYELATTAAHTRPLPNRGPCLMTPRGRRVPLRAAALAYLRVRDRWEDVWRSLVQLVLGTYMVWHARRLRLCARHFEGTAT